MKKILLLAILNFTASLTKGQTFCNQYSLSLENPALFNHVIIPSYPGNKWQIGAPQKTVFTSAFSPSNVIVTDKNNPYPINDTSVFIIKNTACYAFSGYGSLFYGKYFVNSDTLSDFGKIEFSPNNGTTWINLMNLTSWNIKPTLTGNSNGWKDFHIDLQPFWGTYNIQSGDTVLYKFSFISDNIQTNKDGLMYDNITFFEYLLSVPEIQNDNLISIFPNPTSDIITIKEIDKSSRSTIEIFDNLGRSLYIDKDFDGRDLSLTKFPDGLYFLKYSASNSFATKKILVRH